MNPYGVVTLTDEEIVEKYRTMSKRQICRDWKVGINRVRRVIANAENRSG
jgi:hypothetical protein